MTNKNYNKNKIETVMTRQEWERSYGREYKRNHRRRLRRKFVNFCKGIIFGSLALAIVGCAGAMDFADTGYIERNGIFCEADGTQYVCTEDGNYWEVEGLHFSNGDKVSVTFYGNYTEDVTDDIITDIEVRWF